MQPEVSPNLHCIIATSECSREKLSRGSNFTGQSSCYLVSKASLESSTVTFPHTSIFSRDTFQVAHVINSLVHLNLVYHRSMLLELQGLSCNSRIADVRRVKNEANDGKGDSHTHRESHAAPRLGRIEQHLTG